MTTKIDLVEDYLRDLDRALAALPRDRRREIVDEVSEHIAEGRAELEPDDEAGLRNLLDRLGEPEQIAAEARDRYGVPVRERGWVEIAAIVLLLVGGFFAGVGWFVGLILLWLSSIWTLRDKLIGTLIVPGGLATAAYLALASLTAEECQGEVGGAMTCTPGPPVYQTVLWIVLFALVLVGPIFTAVYLARRSRRLSTP